MVKNVNWDERVEKGLDLIDKAPKSQQLMCSRMDDTMSLAGYGDYITEIAAARKILENYEFSTEDDRKLAKKTRAAVNKTAAEFKASTRDAADAHLALYFEERDEVLEGLYSLSSLLASKVGEFDTRYREEKMVAIKDEYDTMLRSDDTMLRSNDALSSIEFDDIMDTRWLNRSIGIAAVSDEMYERVGLVRDMMDMTSRDELENVKTAVRTLAQNDWKFSEALRKTREAHATKIAAKEAAKKLAEERERSAAEKAAAEKTETPEPRVNATASFVVTVPQSQAQEFEKLIATRDDWHIVKIDNARNSREEDN